MPLQFIPVRTPPQIAALASLADEIWHEYFPVLLTPAQIDFMVEKFQSEAALTDQLGQGYEYFLITDGPETLGYTGIRAAEGKLFLSKLYLLESARGRGHASETLLFLEKLCRERALGAIWLTVNRHNHTAIAAYRRNGFTTLREQVVSIGEGFVMDDFVMEKTVGRE